MKSVLVVLTLMCGITACESKENTIGPVEDQLAAVDKKLEYKPYVPKEKKEGTIYYPPVKSKTAKAEAQKRAKDLAGKDCNGDFQIKNDDFEAKDSGKAPSLDYVCEE